MFYSFHMQIKYIKIIDLIFVKIILNNIYPEMKVNEIKMFFLIMESIRSIDPSVTP